MTNLAFKGLQDIHKVEEFSKVKDWEFFQDVSHLLFKHGKIEKFVITLLHTHFSISKNEIIVESADKENTKINIEVKRKNRKSYYPNIWRFIDTGTEIQFIPVQFINIQKTSNVELDKSDLKLFKDYYNLLKKHNKVSKFGIGLKMKHFEIDENKIFVESTYPKSRLQQLVPEIEDKKKHK